MTMAARSAIRIQTLVLKFHPIARQTLNRRCGWIRFHRVHNNQSSHLT
ncbi:hypothetical protein TELCIR_08210 [Teladorsagia circumcincta]|uniref:Uncharacterized protein n=1 Tax=Teladorsagia circumcincta TaxID=45464 RepID=A0A2G9UI76_TELCI|nr:hypothetical protein TELCIR_08210 [Teladorsagia circumcincta]